MLSVADPSGDLHLPLLPIMSMYSMPPQPQYAYAAVPPPPPRQYSGHGTSSAFSSSANPDEDWTKISDLAERRRIQNRIAQRNYRKKLKRRLEDLERRAGEEGTSGSEKQTSVKSSSPKRSPATASKPQKTAAAKPLGHGQFTPPMAQEEEIFFAPPAYNTSRERSHTPPVFPYSSYPPPSDELIMPHSYPSGQYHPPMTAADTYPAYLSATMSVTLPPMNHFNDAVKREYASDEGINYVNYAYIPGMDASPHAAYDSQDPHVSHRRQHTRSDQGC